MRMDVAMSHLHVLPVYHLLHGRHAQASGGLNFGHDQATISVQLFTFNLMHGYNRGQLLTANGTQRCFLSARASNCMHSSGTVILVKFAAMEGFPSFSLRECIQSNDSAAVIYRNLSWICQSSFFGCRGVLVAVIYTRACTSRADHI